jgi:ATP-dependent protease ClpP protease subunit
MIFAANRARGLRASLGKDQPYSIVAAGTDVKTLLIYDPIVSSEMDEEWLGGVSAERLRRELMMAGSEPVHIRIHSPGGDAFAGFNMADAIREYPGEVTVFVDGIAASAAGFLVAACPRVVMSANARVMVHGAWTITLGNQKDHADMLARLIDADKTQAAMFAGKVADYDWESALAAETWFTADQAVELGLASQKAGQPPRAAQAMAFDLAAYRNAPPLEAPAAEAITVSLQLDTEKLAEQIKEAIVNGEALADSLAAAVTATPVATDDEGIARRTRIARVAALKAA